MDNNFEELVDCKSKISKDYIIFKKKLLGEGQFGKVVKGINKKTNTKVAIKIINKKAMTSLRSNINISDEVAKQKFIRETNIMRICNHPHIVKYYGCYEEDDKFYIVMERIDYGDLYSLVNKYGVLDDIIVQKICAQLISALEYCHGNLITHRDLKLENILISNKKNMIVKLSDFGLSTYINMNSFQKTFCGSIHYAAPEIISGNAYNPMKTDIWSIGVIIYALLIGKYPWKDNCVNDTINDIINFNYRIHDFELLDEEIKDLLSKIFVPEGFRISINEIKNHPWIQPHILPSYLEIRNPIKDIDCLIIDKIVSLGFTKQDVLLSVYENRNTIENAMYHILINKYKRVTLHNSNITKFFRKLSYNSEDDSTTSYKLNLTFNDIKEPMTPKSSSDPVRKNRILSKLTPRSYRNKVAKGEINRYSTQMLTSLQKSGEYYTNNMKESPRNMKVDEVIATPRIYSKLASSSSLYVEEDSDSSKSSLSKSAK